LEEVKKVILAETGMGNRLCGSGKTKWVLIVSSQFTISHCGLDTNLCDSQVLKSAWLAIRKKNAKHDNALIERLRA
jgi:hypothetical protein